MAKKNKGEIVLKKEHYTFMECAEAWNKDISYVGKICKGLPIEVIPAMKDGHACSVISAKDKLKIEKEMPALTEELIQKGEVELITIAGERGQDISGLRKTLIAQGYELIKRKRPDGGGCVNVLTEKEYKRFNKENPKRIKL